MVTLQTLPKTIEPLVKDPAIRQYAAKLRPNTDEAQTIAYLAWNVIAEPGDTAAHELVTAHGALQALEIVETGNSAGLEPATREFSEALQRWQPRTNARTVTPSIRNAMRSDAVLLLPGDERWPSIVDDLGTHAPLMLWARGNLTQPLTKANTISIIGARSATPYGSAVASDLAYELATDALTIVSGGAYGIDAAAHRAAIRAGGKTVAFIAGGIDRIYPEGNRALFEEMLENGTIYSEVAPGTAPTRWRFLARNRLLAAAGATIVVEAGYRSGALNIAGHAASLARPLGAVPGPVTSSTSAGCHRLLRDYDATCITSTEDIHELLGTTQAENHLADARMTRVLDALSPRTPRTTLDVAARAGLSERSTEALLALAELEATATRDGNEWKRTA